LAEIGVIYKKLKCSSPDTTGQSKGAKEGRGPESEFYVLSVGSLDHWNKSIMVNAYQKITPSAIEFNMKKTE